MEKNFKGIQVAVCVVLFTCIFQANSCRYYTGSYTYQPKDYSSYAPGRYAYQNYGRYDRYVPQSYSRPGISFQPREEESESAYIIPSYCYGKSTNQIRGYRNIVEGKNNRVYGGENNVYGRGNQIDGERNKVIGCGNDVTGNENGINGKRNSVQGDENIVQGYRNRISGLENTVRGEGNQVEGTGNVVVNGDGC